MKKDKHCLWSDMRDSCMMQDIYSCYTSGQFANMQNFIREYSEIEFFEDLTLFLFFRMPKAEDRYPIYQDIVLKYFAIY